MKTDRPHHMLHFSRPMQRLQHWPMTPFHQARSGRNTCLTAAASESQRRLALYQMAGRQRPQTTHVVSSVFLVLYHYINTVCSASENRKCVAKPTM